MTAASAPERVAFKKLLWVGPLAVVASVVANLIVYFAGRALANPDPAFPPLSMPIPTILFTTIGVLGAVGVYAALGRFVKRPIFVFTWVAVVTLLLSLIPDFGLIGGPMPGATWPAVIILMVMHFVAAGISVGLLTQLARE